MDELLSYEPELKKLDVATCLRSNQLEARLILLAKSENWNLVCRAILPSDLESIKTNIVFTDHEILMNISNSRIIRIINEMSDEEIKDEVNRGRAVEQQPNFNFKSEKVIAVSGLTGGVGATIISINLAFELANLGKNIQLIDFQVENNMVANYLNLRHIRNNFQKLMGNLTISQFSKESEIEYFAKLNHHANNCEGIVIDLPLRDFHKIEGQNLLVANYDLSSFFALKNYLSNQNINMNTWLILNKKLGTPFQKKMEEKYKFLLEDSALKGIWTLPYDLKAVEASQASNEALIESSSSSPLKRALREIATQFVE